MKRTLLAPFSALLRKVGWQASVSKKDIKISLTPDDQQKIAEILSRRTYFDAHFPPIERCDARNDIPFRLSNSCPSCGYMALYARSSWDICGFCFWEDDGQDNHDADEVYGGPNGAYSLTEHRLEMYNWFDSLKKLPSYEAHVNNLIGFQLRLLNSYTQHDEFDERAIVKLLTDIDQLFCSTGTYESYDIGWKFLNEEQISQLKPPADSQ